MNRVKAQPTLPQSESFSEDEFVQRGYTSALKTSVSMQNNRSSGLHTNRACIHSNLP